MKNKYRYKKYFANGGTLGSSLLGSLGEQNQSSGLQEDIDSYNTFNIPSDPMSSVIDSLTGNKRKALESSILESSNNYDYADTTQGLLNNYASEQPFQKVNYKDGNNIGKIYGSHYASIAQGALSGSSMGEYGAIAGAALGGASNILNAFTAKRNAKKLNETIDKANQQQALNLDSNLTQLNRNIGYKNTSNYFADGGQFSNGMTEINNGGTHEENPNGGVPQGVDPQGNPNMVEEGEVKDIENYVFSARNKPTADLLEKHNLPKTFKNNTFAEIAAKVSKESEERPNDPISKNGLQFTLEKVKQVQEEFNAIEEQKRIENDPEYAQQVMQQQQMEAQQQQAQQQQQIPQEQLGLEQQQQQQQLDPTQQIPQENMGGMQAQPNMFAGGSQMYTQGFNGFGYPTQNGFPNLNPNTLLQSINQKNTSNLFSNSFNNPLNTYNVVHKRSNPPTGSGYVSQTVEETSEVPKKDKKFDIKSLLNKENLMYTPALAQAGVLGYLAANKADYSNADAILNMKGQPVKADVSRDYLKYTPYDVNYNLNQLNQQQASTRQGLANNTGGNRANYLASVLASDNLYGTKSGEIYRQALEYNDANRKSVGEFNRGTNQFNIQSKLSADQSNQAENMQLNQLLTQGYQLRHAIDSERDQAISSTIGGLGDSLGAIGRYSFDRNVANSTSRYSILSNGSVVMNPNGDYVDDGKGNLTKLDKNIEKNGGKLKTTKLKINKGLTYEY